MNWLNPFMWTMFLKGYIAEHFVAWHVSSVFSYLAAGATSLAYPMWARDLIEIIWPATKELSSLAVDVLVGFLNTS